MLHCTVLCCAVQCCAVQCCAVLYSAVLYCSVLYCTDNYSLGCTNCVELFILCTGHCTELCTCNELPCTMYDVILHGDDTNK